MLQPKSCHGIDRCYADVHLTAVNEDERNLKLTGHGAWWAGAVEDFKDERRQSRE